MYRSHPHQHPQDRHRWVANVLLVANLGCEMVYVIYHSLIAHQIPEVLAAQVTNEIACAFVNPSFITLDIYNYIESNAGLLSVDSCKALFNKIATCSLLRLNAMTMDKLWTLMTMVYKWQLFLAKGKNDIMTITFRHLDGVQSLCPSATLCHSISYFKGALRSYQTTEIYQCVNRQHVKWLEYFNTIIPMLVRLGVQALDGSYYKDLDQDYFEDFVDTVGDDIYPKVFKVAVRIRGENVKIGPSTLLDLLPELIDIQLSEGESKDFEQNLQQCNFLFEDLGVTNNERSSTTGMSTPCDMDLV